MTQMIARRRMLMLSGVSGFAILAAVAAAWAPLADEVAKKVVYEPNARGAVFELMAGIMDAGEKEFGISYSEVDRQRIPEQTWQRAQPLIAQKYEITQQ